MAKCVNAVLFLLSLDPLGILKGALKSGYLMSKLTYNQSFKNPEQPIFSRCLWMATSTNNAKQSK